MALENFSVEAISRGFKWLEIMRIFFSIYRNVKDVLEIVLYISQPTHTLNSSNTKFLVFAAFGIFWDLLLLKDAVLPSY